MSFFSGDRKGTVSIAGGSSSNSSSHTHRNASRERVAVDGETPGDDDFFFSRMSEVNSNARSHPPSSGGGHGRKGKGRSRSSGRHPDGEKPKKKAGIGSSGGSNSLMSIPQALKLSMLNSGFISIKDESEKVLSSLPKSAVDKETFLKLCDERRKFPILYRAEFQIGSKNEGSFSSRHALKPWNKDKNQNFRAIPFDYNRIVLDPNGDGADQTTRDDYINASYVDSLLEPNAYIVSQGPMENTLNDFWRLIWQREVRTIIMLTKTFDFIKVMCVQYWPALGHTATYANIRVQVMQEVKLANFYIRTFKVRQEGGAGRRGYHGDEGEDEERWLVQFHYVEWPCHSCPFPTALLDFRRRVRQILIEKEDIGRGQVLIHCNDGGGRSGVYCQVDANLELLDEDGMVDVFGYLKKLRAMRKGLVGDVDQIKFVYDTLEEYVICRKTWFPVAELSQRLKHKSTKDPQTKINEYQREFLLICKQTPRFTIGDCAGGHRGDNRDKNRDVLVIPPDNFRPYLTSFQGNTFTDYINAVFVDGYRQSRGYIVTEWPLIDTCSYLWSLVYDYDASAIVVLSNPESSTHYPQFWPDSNRSKKYGPVFTIDHLSHDFYPNIKSWLFRINKKIVSLTELMAGVKAEPKTCKLFQLTCWPMEYKVPSSTNSLVELMNMVERWRQKRSDIGGPIIVVSPDGRSRAGVYCAANACIEQVIQYGEVDVFTAVKTVRRHRPQLIDNMTEYKYCYDVVLHYVLHYLNKETEPKPSESTTYTS